MIKLTSFSNKPIGVLGLGRSGLSAARALKAGGSDVWAWDDTRDNRLNAEKEGIKLTDLYKSDFSKLDKLILSPGIPDQYPKPHILAARARDAGCEIICDIDILARENTAARFIGVSGTNGKSTTTALIGHIFNHANYKAEIGGNLGVPALELSRLDETGTYVLEISSYQLERIPSMELDTALLLNISPDHLDRHGGMDGYVAAKKILFARTRRSSKTIIGMEDSYCRGICMELMIDRGTENIVPISASSRVPGGIYVDNGILIDDLENSQDIIMELSGVSKLPGQHNWQNVAGAYAVARSVGLQPDLIVGGIKSFGGLSHRQELITCTNGVSFINDSKATNTEAAAKALVCYDNIHWILGGQFKEKSLGALESVLEKVMRAYLIGDDVEDLDNLLSSFVPVSRCGDMKTAVREAFRDASLSIPSVVLLSPACASFDQFKDFEERGDAFRNIVEDLGISSS